MKRSHILGITFFLAVAGLLLAQPYENCKPQLLDRCEGCEAAFEYQDTGKELTPTDTLPDFGVAGEPLKLTGTVYQPGGEEPAPDVILYIHQTNHEGVYPTKGDETGWGRRHGYLRGWVKTGPDGRYTFYTIKPGTYPTRTEPAHVHITVLEPDCRYYWIDDFLFDDAPLLTPEWRERLENRGSNGIMTPKEEQGLLIAERDIILGQNIPGYEKN